MFKIFFACLLIDQNVSEKKNFGPQKFFKKNFFLFSFIFWPINKQKCLGYRIHRKCSTSIAICILILEFSKPINHAIWRVFLWWWNFVMCQNKIRACFPLLVLIRNQKYETIKNPKKKTNILDCWKLEPQFGTTNLGKPKLELP